MFDSSRVIAGIIAFLVLAAIPFWLFLIGPQEVNEPELPEPLRGERCVESVDFMRARHMDLLDDWRQSVVREGSRRYVASTGQTFRISLTNTCLGCHGDKGEFCDRCHDFTGVSTTCFDCHHEHPPGLEGGNLGSQ